MTGGPAIKPDRGAEFFQECPTPRRLAWGCATKTAYLLRLTRIVRAHLRFYKIDEPSTCGFDFAKFGMVGINGFNVVDRPISWQDDQSSGAALVAHQPSAEVAVVGVGVYRKALEEASIVLADGYQLLGLCEIGQL